MSNYYEASQNENVETAKLTPRRKAFLWLKQHYRNHRPNPEGGDACEYYVSLEDLPDVLAEYTKNYATKETDNYRDVHLSENVHDAAHWMLNAPHCASHSRALSEGKILADFVLTLEARPESHPVSAEPPRFVVNDVVELFQDPDNPDSLLDRQQWDQLQKLKSRGTEPEKQEKPDAWRYVKLVNRHITGEPLPGQIQINGVWGDPISVKLSLEEPVEPYVVEKTPLYALNPSNELAVVRAENARLREDLKAKQVRLEMLVSASRKEQKQLAGLRAGRKDKQDDCDRVQSQEHDTPITMPYLEFYKLKMEIAEIRESNEKQKKQILRLQMERDILLQMDITPDVEKKLVAVSLLSDKDLNDVK